MKDVYSLILAELEERGCAYVDRFPPYYIASTGCHLFNLMNQQREIFIESGRVRDTRLHVIFCSPPGFSKTFWIEQFLRGQQAILLGSGIEITLQAAMTGMTIMEVPAQRTITLHGEAQPLHVEHAMMQQQQHSIQACIRNI